MGIVMPAMKASRGREWPRSSNGTAIFFLAVALICTALVSLTTLGHIKDVAITASLHGQPIRLIGLAASLRAQDAVVCLLAAATLLILPWLEWRRRTYSRLLATMTEPEGWLVLTILTAWFGHAYLNAGVLLGGDTGTHIGRFLEVARGLEAGELAQWTNYQYAGAPLLWFTGPLTYVVGGLVAFVARDAVLATKIILFTLHLLSGWLYFALLRRLGIRVVPALLVAAGFAGSFAHLHLFLYRGAIPQAFTIVFLILLFHAATGLCREIGARWTNCLAVSLTTAGLIVNHQPHALFAAFYLAVFGGLALVLGFWHWRGVPMLVAAGLLGAAASAVAVIPVLFEADWVMLQPEGASFGLHVPTLHRLLDLVLWRDTRTTWGIDYWAYLGLGLITFGIAGAAATLRGHLRPGMAGFAVPACACFSIGLFLYNPVVRDILFLLFFLGLLAAPGLDWLIDRHLPGRALLAAVCVTLLDLASTSIQPVARTDKGFLIEAGRKLERDAPNQRVVQLGTGPDGHGIQADIGPDGNPLSYYATVQRVAGNHNMAATRIHNFLVGTVKLAEADLRETKAISPDTRALLGLFNVARVICNSSIANGCPASMQDATDDRVLGRYLPIAATPAIFSRYLVAGTPDPGLEKPMLWPDDFEKNETRSRIAAVGATLHRFLAAEHVDIASRMAQAIAVRDVVPGPTLTKKTDTPWHPVIRDYAVGLDTVRLRVETDDAGYVQLSHPWFPATLVSVNGETVRPLRGMIDLIVLPIRPGVSVIELRAGATRVETLSLGATLAALVGSLAFSLAIRRHDLKTHRPVTASETGSARETMTAAAPAVSAMEM